MSKICSFNVEQNINNSENDDQLTGVDRSTKKPHWGSRGDDPRNPRVRRVGSGREYSAVVWWSRGFLRGRAWAVITAQKEADAASATIRKRSFFMFFVTNQRCSRCRRRRAQPQEGQWPGIRVICGPCGESTATLHNPFPLPPPPPPGTTKDSAPPHHPRPPDHPRCPRGRGSADRWREKMRKFLKSSSSRFCAFSMTSSLKQSKNCTRRKKWKIFDMFSSYVQQQSTQRRILTILRFWIEHCVFSLMRDLIRSVSISELTLALNMIDFQDVWWSSFNSK